MTFAEALRRIEEKTTSTAAELREKYAEELDRVRPATIAEKIEYLLTQAEYYLDPKWMDGSPQDYFDGKLLLELAEMLEPMRSDSEV